MTHSGNMGVKQGLDVVLDAAALNRRDGSTLFLLVGTAPMRRGFSAGPLTGVAQCAFLPMLGKADFRGLLAASGVCLVTQQQSVSEIAFPSKIVTYLAAGRPIIAR